MRREAAGSSGSIIGRWRPSYRKSPKRRVVAAPKFSLAHVSVVNRLAKRGELLPGSELYGKAFESWVSHELSAYRSDRECDWDVSCWRLVSGISGWGSRGLPAGAGESPSP